MVAIFEVTKLLSNEFSSHMLSIDNIYFVNNGNVPIIKAHLYWASGGDKPNTILGLNTQSKGAICYPILLNISMFQYFLEKGTILCLF